jgi:hypothetical protein
MMAQRDMGYVSMSLGAGEPGTDVNRYGYMPGPMSNPLQYGPGGPSYSSLAPLPGTCGPMSITVEVILTVSRLLRRTTAAAAAAAAAAPAP